MLKNQEIIEKILSLRPDLSKDHIREMIKNKQENAENLLTEEGAVYLVANELGINLFSPNTISTKIKIKDLITGANDVTITGRVIAVSSPQPFVRKDGIEGKVARLILSDDTGTVNVVIWNDKTKVISQKKISPDQVVRISHGYVRKGLNGNPELNVGRRGTIVTVSSQFSIKKTMDHFKKICDLREGDIFVGLIGIIKGLSPVSTFKRANQRLGKVVRARLEDDTGRIKAVFWDEKADNIIKSQIGNTLQILGGQVRRGLNNVLEVHVGRLTRLKVVKDSGLLNLPLKLTKIGDLTSGMADIDVLGRVVEVGDIREFERNSGKKGKVGSLFLIDETGSVRLSLWDNQADLLTKISSDDVVLVGGGYTREGWGGNIDLNLGTMGTAIINPKMEEVKALPKAFFNVISIDKLKVGMRNLIIEGKLVEEPVIKSVTVRDGSSLRVASLIIQDQTGKIQVSLWRDLVDKVEGLTREGRLQIKNAYVKMGFDGSIELSSGFFTEVKVLSKGGVRRKTLVDHL